MEAPTTAPTTANSATTTATVTEPGGIVIPLKHPFNNAAGERIESLTLRRAKRKDLTAAARYSKEDVEQETFVFARLTGRTMEDIEELDAADNKALQESFRKMVG